MKKIINLLLLLTISLSLFSQTTYRVATDGTGDYTSPSLLPALVAGDSVLFKAGDVYRETVSLNVSGNASNFIYFGKYGEGRNPKFLGSDKVTSWIASGTSNVWESSNTLTYYSEGSVFFMTNDSVTWGEPQSYTAGYTNLTAEYDWTSNAGKFYVYSTTDPDVTYDSVEVSQRATSISFSAANSYIEINGLTTLFALSKGIWFGYPAVKGASHLVFRNDTMRYVGEKSGANDYLLSFFHSNVLVENCLFSDGGRRAISINTYTSPAGGRRIENILIRDNTFKNGFHTTALDLAVLGQSGDTIRNLYFYNNIIDDSETTALDAVTYTTNQIFIQEGNADAYQMDSIFIFGNLFKEASTRWLNFDANGGTGIDMTVHIYNNTFAGFNQGKTTSPFACVGLNGLDSLISRNNIFYENFPDNTIEANIFHNYSSPASDDYKVGWNIDYDLFWSFYPSDAYRKFLYNRIASISESWNINEWAAFQAAQPTYEANAPTPANPLFTDFDNGDYTLQATSTAIEVGEVLPYIIIDDPYGVADTINKYDVVGVEYSRTTPSLGAFEYSAAAPEPPAVTVNAKSGSFGGKALRFSGKTTFIR